MFIWDCRLPTSKLSLLELSDVNSPLSSKAVLACVSVDHERESENTTAMAERGSVQYESKGETTEWEVGGQADGAGGWALFCFSFCSWTHHYHHHQTKFYLIGLSPSPYYSQVVQTRSSTSCSNYAQTRIAPAVRFSLSLRTAPIGTCTYSRVSSVVALALDYLQQQYLQLSAGAAGSERCSLPLLPSLYFCTAVFTGLENDVISIHKYRRILRSAKVCRGTNTALVCHTILVDTDTDKFSG